MKNRLKTDLKFLNNVVGRILTSLSFTTIPLMIVYLKENYRFKEDLQEILIYTLIISFVLIMIGVYFFSAWLFSEDNNNETNK